MNCRVAILIVGPFGKRVSDCSTLLSESKLWNRTRVTDMNMTLVFYTESSELDLRIRVWAIFSW